MLRLFLCQILCPSFGDTGYDKIFSPWRFLVALRTLRDDFSSIALLLPLFKILTSNVCSLGPINL